MHCSRPVATMGHAETEADMTLGWDTDTGSVPVTSLPSSIVRGDLSFTANKPGVDGGILLARLPKGQIGEETSRLMGSFILASAWQTATARARIAEDSRRDAVAYVDEAHNFLNRDTNRTRQVRDSAADHVLLFTATPINRGAADLLQLVGLLGADNFDDTLAVL